MKLTVKETRADLLEVTSFGDTEPRHVRGRQWVTFAGRSTFEVEWEGEMPALGDVWVLRPAERGEGA